MPHKADPGHSAQGPPSCFAAELLCCRCHHVWGYLATVSVPTAADRTQEDKAFIPGTADASTTCLNADVIYVAHVHAYCSSTFTHSIVPSDCTSVHFVSFMFPCLQCAHGRPTLVPLVDVDKLRKEVGAVQSRNAPRAKGPRSPLLVRQSTEGATFHGLQQQEISLGRLMQRCKGGT